MFIQILWNLLRKHLPNKQRAAHSFVHYAGIYYNYTFYSIFIQKFLKDIIWTHYRHVGELLQWQTLFITQAVEVRVYGLTEQEFTV